MEYKIELYSGENQDFFGTMPFMFVVRTSIEGFLGRRLHAPMIKVIVLGVPDDNIVTGIPRVENLVPTFGYTYVKVEQDGFVIYQHPHPLSEIVTQPLQSILKEKYPEQTQWKFRLDIPGIPKASKHRPTPAVEGAVRIKPLAPRQKPAFSIRRVAEPDPPIATLGDLGVDLDRPTPDTLVKVLLPHSLQMDLFGQRPLSSQVEEGGFLIGKVYRDGERSGRYLLEITEALKAEHTGASLLHFTFTGDSFANVKVQLRQHHPGDRVLGWYHTHLFPATDDLGLSSIDLRLHFGTFTIPWQVAGLININSPKTNDRTLRFYVRQQNTMVLCPYWIINERDRHSNPDTQLGHHSS